jgi:hypothetical protein
LLASVKGATEEADEAILLGERAFFLANRLPFFVRHQVRLGSREVVGDAAGLLDSTQTLTESVKNLQPIAAELPAIEGGGTEVVREARLLLEDIKTLLPTPQQVDRLDHTLETANGLMKNTNAVIDDLHATTAAAKGPDSPVAQVSSRVDAALGRALVYLIVLGAIWSILWWGGYVVAKRIARDQPKHPRGEASASA